VRAFFDLITTESHSSAQMKKHLQIVLAFIGGSRRNQLESRIYDPRLLLLKVIKVTRGEKSLIVIKTIKGAMKKLLVLTLLSLLVACSQNPDNLTLSCYGAAIKAEAKQELVTPQVTRTYKFQNYKIDDYECAQRANIISCNFVKEENGTRERKRIIYDTSTQSFAEIDAIWAVGEKINANERNITRTEFIGRCQKPILN